MLHLKSISSTLTSVFICNEKTRRYRSVHLGVVVARVTETCSHSGRCLVCKWLEFSNSMKAVPRKMRKKDRKLKRLPKISKRITSNYMGKRNCNILSFGYVEVSGYNCVMTWMVAHFIFWPSNEATVNSIHAGCIRYKQQQKLQSLSLIISEDHK